jgi:ketosteroid isomerase-like protein
MMTTLSHLEDKLAIEELIARYNHSIDSFDMTTWLDCWTEDAIFDGIGKYLVGKTAITEFANSYATTYGARMPSGRHFTVNIASKINGDVATATSYLQLWSTGEKGAKIAFTGVYSDQFRKEQGQWRFSSRRMVMDVPPVA